MAAKYFNIEIVTPSGMVVSGEYERFFAPSIDGYFEILANHTPFMAALKIGKIKLTKGNEIKWLTVSSGFAEIINNRVTILAETAEISNKVDLERANAAKERAEKRLARRDPDINIERARISLQKALNRLNVASL